MNEETVGNGGQSSVQAQEASFKRQRGMFFGHDLEKEVSAFKNELFNLTNNNIVTADVEFAEINRLVVQKTDAQCEDPCYKKDLLQYLPRLKFLLELCFILKRIQPYCEFVDDAILPHMKTTLEKIRLACGCDLDHPSTWGNAQIHTAKICEDATRLEVSKLTLTLFYDYVYDDMEWFVMSFKSAVWENKRDFFVEINKNEQLLGWIQPWIEIAEEKEKNWRSALFKSMDVLSAKEVVVEKRVYE